MKYLLIISLIAFTHIIAYDSGGSVNNLKYSLKNLEQEQIQIEKKLKEISSFLDDYTAFASSYKDELIKIIKSGAKCIRINNTYHYYYQKNGSNNSYTKLYKKYTIECKNMKENRLSSLQHLNIEFNNLKNKVDELVKLKQIAVDRANTIKEYIEGLKSTLDINNRYNNL